MSKKKKRQQSAPAKMSIMMGHIDDLELGLYELPPYQVGSGLSPLRGIILEFIRHPAAQSAGPLIITGEDGKVFRGPMHLGVLMYGADVIDQLAEGFEIAAKTLRSRSSSPPDTERKGDDTSRWVW